MKVLVTGGAGFIGSHIAEKLLQLNHSVRIIDNLSTGNIKNIEHLLSEIEFIKGDITNDRDVKIALKDVDYVFHQAALPSVERSVKDPLRTNEHNIKGTLNLLWYSVKMGVKKFIYASSSSVYGDSPTLPKKENFTPNPLSPYAVTKLTGEYYCSIFTKLYKLPTISLRYFNVFGPRQNPESQYSAVIPKFIKAVLKGEPIYVYGDGEQTRDFTYVENVVLANILAMNNDKILYGIFNVGTGKRVSLNTFIKLLSKLTEREIKPIYTSPRPGDVRHSLASLKNINEKLGYSPKFTFEQGLKITFSWYKKNLNTSFN